MRDKTAFVTVFFYNCCIKSYVPPNLHSSEVHIDLMLCIYESYSPLLTAVITAPSSSATCFAILLSTLILTLMLRLFPIAAAFEKILRVRVLPDLELIEKTPGVTTPSVPILQLRT